MFHLLTGHEQGDRVGLCPSRDGVQATVAQDQRMMLDPLKHGWSRANARLAQFPSSIITPLIFSPASDLGE
jgi:hypothetical protein